MATDLTRVSEVRPTRDGVVVLSGYGLRVAVHRRHLVVSDGIGRTRRFGRFSRATSGLKRLVVLGKSGMVTLEALRWLRDIGAAVIQIDRGDVVAALSPTGLDEPRLRRAQAVAKDTAIGVEIARTLLREKLRGQREILTRLEASDQAQTTLTAALEALESASSIDGIRSIEAQAAMTYWEAWTRVPVTFSRSDLQKVPDHWRTIGQRGSPLSSSPRLAANPANAILNYLFAILEAETRIACLAVGLDPGLGIVHTDQKSRDSMALDMMEAIRPQVEGYVLDLLESQVFLASDFRETARGQCALLPPIACVLAATAATWGLKVGPITERVARALASDPRAGNVRLPTPLTQTNRSLGRTALRRRPRAAKAVSSKPTLIDRCPRCGAEIAKGRSLCDSCLVGYEREAVARLKAAGSSAIARLAAQGKDPAHGGRAARKRRESNLKRMREAKEWDRLHQETVDLERFKQEILPKLSGIPLKRIMLATGLSLRYCSLIRRGLYVPHARHWQGLLEAAQAPHAMKSNPTKQV